jgi:membrane-bound metal-dependent hydrolase YbcI (DUF457 family)
MRMVTHFVFGVGTAVVLSPTIPAETRIYLAVALSLLVSLVIDELGHVTRKGFVSRSPLTHSVVTAPLWGGAVGYLLWKGGTELGLGTGGLEWQFVLLGAAVAWSHLLLDSMTERGVFLFTERIALAHFSSRNVLLNAVFILLGVALILTLPFG